MNDAKPARPRILLVDDDADLLVLIEARLRALGRFEIVCSSRPHEVLSEIAELRPDLIVSDIDMPGMDGCRLADALQRNEASRLIPLFFLSSLVSPGESESSLQAGHGPRMFSKRAPIERLALAIKETLERDSAARNPGRP